MEVHYLMYKIQWIKMHNETVRNAYLYLKKRPATYYVNSLVLETFSNFPLATVISLLFSVHLPIPMEQLGSRRTQIYEAF